MKTIRFHWRLIKSWKSENFNENHEKHKNLRIPYEKYEIHKNHRIPREKQTNHEIHRIPLENQENY